VSTPRTLSNTEAQGLRAVLGVPSTPVLPQELTQAVSAKEEEEDEDEASSSESSGDQVLDTSAKEVSAEVDESVKLRKQTSSSSLSSSSSKARIVYTLPKRVKRERKEHDH
jgi:hypothetical protein